MNTGTGIKVMPIQKLQNLLSQVGISLSIHQVRLIKHTILTAMDIFYG